MPAFRSRKMCAGYAEEAAQARKEARKQTQRVARQKAREAKKNMTEEEKEADKLAELARKAARDSKKKWGSTLVPWVHNDKFSFPVGTVVMYKSDAKSAYSLTEKEVLTLKYESIYGAWASFVSQKDAVDLSHRKYEAGAYKAGFTDGQVNERLRLFKKVNNSNSHKKNFKEQY
ncbi:hypothetical protein GALMADRAFT_211185 [Galerina marginata CBS 339.88]|uniref:Uncharacterized protein n=1 Tax=Galerina marginata (strain CBS 339.88) TaxID=685588 RepID=A0A067SXP9_GALM3|nr:hypothetical protein GALMADRAFT_211185 [Galerina marginata CBS 339.88]